LASIKGRNASIASLSSATVHLDLDLRSQACGQHHHTHDALGVDPSAIAAEMISLLKLPASLVSLAEARA
jgi:hypothetical protein